MAYYKISWRGAKALLLIKKYSTNTHLCKALRIEIIVAIIIGTVTALAAGKFYRKWRDKNADR